MSDFSAKMHQILPLSKNATPEVGLRGAGGRPLSPSYRHIVKWKRRKRMCTRQENGLDAIAAMVKVELRVVVEIKLFNF